MKGLIHIYCGDGKGKTTAAIGLAVRAAGRGKRVVIARFLKNDDSGEVGVLERVPGITLIPCRKSFGFTWNMNEKERQEGILRSASGRSLGAGRGDVRGGERRGGRGEEW